MSKRKYRRLTPAEWAEARALWESGETVLQELSVRFGVSERALQAHFAKHSTLKGSKAKELAAAVQETVFADIFEDPAAARAKGRQARTAPDQNATKIEGLIMGQLAEAQKDPANAHRALSALRALALATQALERAHSMKWASSASISWKMLRNFLYCRSSTTPKRRSRRSGESSGRPIRTKASALRKRRSRHEQIVPFRLQKGDLVVLVMGPLITSRAWTHRSPRKRRTLE